jgi:hypothetical protein
MKKRILLAMCLTSGLLALIGCKGWAQTGVQTISINAPSSVNQHGEFYFTLTAKDRDGQPASVAFQWSVEWVGVEGSTHKGKSGVSEKIRVKGGLGDATLRILGYDEKDNWGTIASHVFRVE